MSDLGRTGIVICSYNMPEYTDALVEHIREYVKLPYELMVFDNGSDLVPPSQYTTYREPENIQMVPGFMKGLRLLTDGRDFDYYWLITTSVRFDPHDHRDPLEVLTPILQDRLTYTIQPSQTMNYGAWKAILRPQTDQIRPVHSLECSCPLYRADNFNRLGRWREELTYGWGFSSEIHYKARQAGLGIYTHDGYVMFKDTEVGYQMERMGMPVMERRQAATEESNRVLGAIYGDDWRNKLNAGFDWPSVPPVPGETTEYREWIETQVGVHGFINKPEHYEIAECRAIDKLFAGIPKLASILDVGCGTGKGMACLRALGYENVRGIELSAPKANIAGAFNGDVTNFIFPEDYDVIYSSHSFEHMFDPEAALHKLKQIARPHARFIFILPYVDTGDPKAHCASDELGLHVDDDGATVAKWFTDRGMVLVDKKIDDFREPEIWLMFKQSRMA